MSVGLKQFITSLIIIFLACNCKKKEGGETALPFASAPVESPIAAGIIDEVSGIADSKKNSGYLLVHEDSGNPAEIGLLKWDGTFLKKISIEGVTNRDWEEMTIASGPVANTHYIYIADIGDNNATHSNYFIYRFPEPSVNTDKVTSVEKITFQYADGAHDAEAFLVDNGSKDIYIITKRDAQSKIYKITNPQNTNTIHIANLVATLSFNSVVGAALSPNGKEIILKTYTNLYYWQRTGGETIEQTLQKSPVKLGYKMEPQGEAITFKNDNSGFYTLSEIGFSNSVALQFYKRL